MRHINKIIVHCSASDNPDQDNLESVRDLHTSPKDKKITWGKYSTFGRNWYDVGYHFFIRKDGKIELGRPIHLPGAHTRGENKNSIGVCFSGESDIPTQLQIESWRLLRRELLLNFGLTDSDVYPHNHFNKYKTCPNFDLETL